MKKNIGIFLLGFLTAALLGGGIFYYWNSQCCQTPATVMPESALTVVKSDIVTPQSDAKAETATSVPASAVPAAAASNSQPVKVTSEETPAFAAMVSKNLDEHSLMYQVKSGDTLVGIAKRHKVAPDLIKRVNGLPDDRIRLGAKLKIPTYRLNILVDKSQNVLTLKGDETVLKTYIVSTGEKNSTPVGLFKITDKLVDPTWYRAGAVVKSGSPQNVLGTRWMGIEKKGYGIHGTTEPEKLGTQCTAGCVRMKNQDVEELYAIVPSGTEVTIID